MKFLNHKYSCALLVLSLALAASADQADEEVDGYIEYLGKEEAPPSSPKSDGFVEKIQVQSQETADDWDERFARLPPSKPNPSLVIFDSCEWLEQQVRNIEEEAFSRDAVTEFLYVVGPQSGRERGSMICTFVDSAGRPIEEEYDYSSSSCDEGPAPTCIGEREILIVREENEPITTARFLDVTKLVNGACQ